jgi:hypothetical protein
MSSASVGPDWSLWQKDFLLIIPTMSLIDRTHAHHRMQSITLTVDERTESNEVLMDKGRKNESPRSGPARHGDFVAFVHMNYATRVGCLSRKLTCSIATGCRTSSRSVEIFAFERGLNDNVAILFIKTAHTATHKPLAADIVQITIVRAQPTAGKNMMIGHLDKNLEHDPGC